MCTAFWSRFCTVHILHDQHKQDCAVILTDVSAGMKSLCVLQQVVHCVVCQAWAVSESRGEGRREGGRREEGRREEGRKNERKGRGREINL